MMTVFIFDLDETVINSKHRTPNNPDGTLNLAAYIEKHTPENVWKDTLLPLARTMQKLIASGAHVWIVTARDMQACDYEFLKAHEISPKIIMSRDRVKSAKHYRLGDGEYKTRWVRQMLNLKQYAKAHCIMFDDAKPVIRSMRSIGVSCLNAIKINERLATV